jgi:hypothetical protein
LTSIPVPPKPGVDEIVPELKIVATFALMPEASPVIVPPRLLEPISKFQTAVDPL